VRCGIIVRDGELVCLPLEEYAMDPQRKPIRTGEDKLARTVDGDLYLVAKDRAKAWIVADDDTLTQRVWAAARRCHVALGCRHYSLFDFRIDQDGRPWFLEAGLYCSYSPGSVIAVMASAIGIAVPDLLEIGLSEMKREGTPCLT
jgi:D-alanine-D-alanine ligase